jgi:hypothetical protein
MLAGDDFQMIICIANRGNFLLYNLNGLAIIDEVHSLTMIASLQQKRSLRNSRRKPAL